MTNLVRTPLFDLHVALGAKMVPFAGYEMPVQYPAGVMKEHLHTRDKAGLFDVSHMGQILLKGDSFEAIAAAFETMMPVDVVGLKENRQRYGLFTNGTGGIEDDLMFANRGDHIYVVVNAACKEADIARMRDVLPDDVAVEVIENRALLALQGPSAEDVLATLSADVRNMRFMDVETVALNGVDCWVSRSGYTGEDGYEISVPADAAEDLARALLAHEAVEPIGLGARDSLRLEAGLCLYGNDLDSDTSPVEANLNWAMQKARRPGGARAGGYPGSDRIGQELQSGAGQLRVGLKPEGRAPMRAGVPLFDSAEGGEQIGTVTSGGFGPSVGGPVAMGYVRTEHTQVGTTLFGELRGKRQPITVTALPFFPSRFKR